MIKKIFSICRTFFKPKKFIKNEINTTSRETSVCNKCFSKGECNCKNKKIIKIDNFLVDIIAKLNRSGYKTKYCCEGHVEIFEETKEIDMDTPYILFKYSLRTFLLLEKTFNFLYRKNYKRYGH